MKRIEKEIYYNMRSLVYLIFAGLLLLSISATTKAQEPLIYSFQYKASEKLGDSIPDLFCVMNLQQLAAFEKVRISYNDKTKTYPTANFSKGKSKKYQLEGDLIYFKIDEILQEPFVSIYAIDKEEKEKPVNLKNGQGNIINPEIEKAKWHKHKVRNDSMDFVRRYDNVYVGEDGKPRYKDKKGKEFIIEKDHVYKDRSKKE